MDYAGATVQIKCGVSSREGYSKEKFESSKRRTTLKMLINIFFLIFLSRKLEYFVVNNKYIKVCVSDSLIYLFCRIEYQTVIFVAKFRTPALQDLQNNKTKKKMRYARKSNQNYNETCRTGANLSINAPFTLKTQLYFRSG